MSKKILLEICFALCSIWAVAGRRHYLPLSRRATQVTYSPELLQDLREFIHLIPTTTIDEIVAKHMFSDFKFIKAITFLDSAEFKQLQQRAETLPEIIEVINFVHLNDTNQIRSKIRFDVRLRQQLNTNTYASYGYEFIDVPAGKSVNEGMVVVLLPLEENVVEQSSSLGSFVSFAQEVVEHLPRDRYVALINEKRKSSKVFPKFYEAIRSDAFKELLERTMKTPNVQNIIKTLGSHDIDAQGLKNIALDVISWGPTVRDNKANSKPLNNL